MIYMWNMRLYLQSVSHHLLLYGRLFYYVAHEERRTRPLTFLIPGSRPTATDEAILHEFEREDGSVTFFRGRLVVLWGGTRVGR